LLAAVFLVVQLANAIVQKYLANSAMLMVVSCSAAISANCHRPEKDEDAYLLPVRWGVVGESEGRKICSFTTMRDVEPPNPGDIVFGLDVLNTKSEAKRTKFFAYLKALLKKAYSKISSSRMGGEKRA
jgi:hypothetical protein